MRRKMHPLDLTYPTQLELVGTVTEPRRYNVVMWIGPQGPIYIPVNTVEDGGALIQAMCRYSPAFVLSVKITVGERND